MPRLSKAAKEALIRVRDTGSLYGKCKMTHMILERGYVEKIGVDKRHFTIFRLTPAGVAALHFSEDDAQKAAERMITNDLLTI